jgi:energy-converting hydrogenase Eha subunit G
MKIKQSLLEYGFLASFAWEDILMNNMLLFAAGLIITLVSGMGVIVYVTSMSYAVREEKRKFPEDLVTRRAELAELK